MWYNNGRYIKLTLKGGIYAYNNYNGGNVYMYDDFGIHNCYCSFYGCEINSSSRVLRLRRNDKKSC